MKGIAKLTLEGINGIFCVIVILGPFLIPSTSSSSQLERAAPAISAIYLWGVFFGLWVSRKFSNLTEDARKRRNAILHYYPIWSLPSFIFGFYVLGRILDIKIH